MIFLFPFPGRLKYLLPELAAVVNGNVYELGNDGLRPDPRVTEEKDCSFSIDSRTIQPGQIFIALQGDRGDGHDYLEQALQQGAAGLLVSLTGGSVFCLTNTRDLWFSVTDYAIMGGESLSWPRGKAAKVVLISGMACPGTLS